MSYILVLLVFVSSSYTKYPHTVLAFSFSPSQVNELVLLVVNERTVFVTGAEVSDPGWDISVRKLVVYPLTASWGRILEENMRTGFVHMSFAG